MAINKEFLKPGMLVRFRDGDVAIVAALDAKANNIALCWNDNSGRSLYLKDYEDTLTFLRCPEYDIMAIYDVGSFIKPFDMDINKRSKLWERDKVFFSDHDRLIALDIKSFLQKIYNTDDKILYYMKRYGDKIFICDDIRGPFTFVLYPYILAIPASAFYANIPEKTNINLDTIAYFHEKEEQPCQDTSTKTD